MLLTDNGKVRGDERKEQQVCRERRGSVMMMKIWKLRAGEGVLGVIPVWYGKVEDYYI